MYLPRLTAKTPAQAAAQLRERRAILLQAALDMLDRAELFTDIPEVCDSLIGEARSLFAQAERCAL